MVRALSNDTHVTLLLCAWFGGEQKPLSTNEYNLLAFWLHQNEYRPVNLMDRSCDPSEVAHEVGLRPRRLTALLDRGITLGFYLEEWKRRDFWILGRGDDAYPKRIQGLLRSQAPPLLFGTGNASVLDLGGTAVMGPDQVMQDQDGQVETIVRLSVGHQRTTIAAGDQRIASVAISNGIKGGGTAIWILPGPLLSDPLGKALRRAKASEQLVMISNRSPADKRLLPQEPEIGQLLMALCDSAVYIDGTEFSMDPYSLQMAMHGAHGKRNCFVWASEQVTMAAEELIHGGAHPWTDVESALDARLLESHPETIQQEFKSASGEKAEHLESVTPDEPTQSVGDSTERELKYIEPDTGKRQEAVGVQRYLQDKVQYELFDSAPGPPLPEETWELTGTDAEYPEVLRKVMGDKAPTTLTGIGDQSLLGRGGYAIIGPSSIPNERIHQAIEIAKNQKETVIVVGPLRLAEEIVKAFQPISRRIIWVLDEETLKQDLAGLYLHVIREGCLVMIAPKTSTKESDHMFIGLIASALSTSLLYVDEADSQDDHSRGSQSGMKDIVLRRPNDSQLLHGTSISPDGMNLIESGVSSWTDPQDTLNELEIEMNETSGIQGELF